MEKRLEVSHAAAKSIPLSLVDKVRTTDYECDSTHPY